MKLELVVERANGDTEDFEVDTESNGVMVILTAIELKAGDRVGPKGSMGRTKVPEEDSN